MNRPKIYDCIIFYDENLLVNSRFEILDEVDLDGIQKDVLFKNINYDFNSNS